MYKLLSEILLLFGLLLSSAVASQENAVWEVFTDRSNVREIVVSEDEKTVWVGTEGGLEQRDAATGELVRLFTTLDGLPSNSISALSFDLNGGLWIGTWNGAFAYRSVDDDWTVYDIEDFGLPKHSINALSIDSSGGLWIGTDGSGLVYRNVDGDWTVYNTDNSGLPDNLISALSFDSSGGLWIATGGGLAYRSVGGDWTVYNTENSGVPDNFINALSFDSSGGLWIATGSGLAYRSVGDDWTVYNTENSGLPNNWVSTLSFDSSGGQWIGTGNGLAYRSVGGKWTVYSEELPNSNINALGETSGGLWIGTYGGGLAYRSVGGGWTFYNNSGLPDNSISILSFDSSGQLWIGSYGSLAYRNADGDWTVYNSENSGLPNSYINALSFDSSGGQWIATGDGLAYHSASDDWTVYNTDNSGLPSNDILALSIDSSGGLWIGTSEGGLAYRSASGDWTVYNTDNSGLPSNWVSALSIDSSGGLWIGTHQGGLAHRSVAGDWTVYNENNSGLPFNNIQALSFDSSGGLWIGTWGLAYRNVKGDWTVYNTDNSGLPSNSISALSIDSNGGLWIGADGLAYRSASGDWTVYNTDNSGLPSNWVSALSIDSSGGLWIGTSVDGLAHLTFSQKNTLCDDNLSDDQCEALLTNKRAALIIAGGGTDQTNTLWESTAAISNYIYTMLRNRGFDNDEIYYLSPQSYADFNGDGLDDCIVDAPATPRCRIKDVENPIPERAMIVDDVRQAFAHAKTRGQLEQPLYVFFINHGSPDRFQLSKYNDLEVSEFKAIVDDYQNSTGNEVALVIDTCYSGVLLQKLIAPNRAIISSTGNGLAYFDRSGKQGFSRFLAKGLLKGMSFYEAFDYARDKQDKLVKSLSIGQDQIPQWYDGSEDGQWLRKLFINGDFVTADISLTVQALTTSTSLSVDQSLALSAKVNQDKVKRVWAIIKPPKVQLVMDSYGTPILAFPHLNLFSTEQERVWGTVWDDAVYNGVYEITFYGEDMQGNISASDPVTVEVSGGIDSPENSSVNIQVAKDRYQRGEHFQAQLTEELAWGYDLYAAVVLPDVNFFALRNTNQLAGVNEAKKWIGDRTFHTPVTLFDLILPESLPTGQYCIYGILSPENELVLETPLDLWVWTVRCFEVF
jgi:ligand-binding sensor domain-containing protein